MHYSVWILKSWRSFAHRACTPAPFTILIWVCLGKFQKHREREREREREKEREREEEKEKARYM